MKQEVVLVAASGLAREVMAAVEAAGEQQVVGMLDDDVSLRGTEVGGMRVFGGTGSALEFPDAQFVVCAGGGAARRRIVENLFDQGVGPDRFGTVLHPSSDVPASCRVGPGSILLSNATLTADVVVGRHVVLMPQTVLTHDDRIADYATLCAGVVLGGNVQIEEAAYLGMNSSVRQGVRVGAGATLGMGSVLLGDLPEGQTWVGVPAVEISTAADARSERKNAEQAGPRRSSAVRNEGTHAR